jgi:hypothetical protein
MRLQTGAPPRFAHEVVMDVQQNHARTTRVLRTDLEAAESAFEFRTFIGRPSRSY